MKTAISGTANGGWSLKMGESNWQLHYRHASKKTSQYRMCCHKRNENVETNLHEIRFVFAIIDWPECWPKMCNRPLHWPNEMSFSIQQWHTLKKAFNYIGLLRWMQKLSHKPCNNKKTKWGTINHIFINPPELIASIVYSSFHLYICMSAFAYPLNASENDNEFMLPL